MSTNNIKYIYTLLLLSILSGGRPSITNLTNSTYTEQGSAYILDNDATVANGDNYGNGYIEFSITSGSDTGDTFSLTSSGTPNTAGHISITGTDVYLGQGGSKTLIGTVDGTNNGVSGQPYKINFKRERWLRIQRCCLEWLEWPTRTIS